MQSLLDTLRTCPEEGPRTMAAVLLRRIFNVLSKSLDNIDAQVLERVKEGLVSVLSQEPSASIARRVGSTIGQLATYQFKTWPALMPAVLALTQNTEESRRATAYFTVGQLCEFAVQVRLATCAPSCPRSPHLRAGPATFRQGAACSVPNWPGRQRPASTPRHRQGENSQLLAAATWLVMFSLCGVSLGNYVVHALA